MRRLLPTDAEIADAFCSHGSARGSSCRHENGGRRRSSALVRLPGAVEPRAIRRMCVRVARVGARRARRSLSSLRVALLIDAAASCCPTLASDSSREPRSIHFLLSRRQTRRKSRRVSQLSSAAELTRDLASKQNATSSTRDLLSEDDQSRIIKSP